ncbi:MAG: division/cell wall cluster transcriptional repressor MraZ, partial [Clostridia bacterium]|nr:division/cell wall cluster transcriptional repressor MraZ [Clostridia bacterium]
ARLGSLNPQLNIFLNQFDALSFRGQECDGQGRILLPQRVREELLFGEKDVEITGANDHVRIISLSRAKAAKESFQNNLPDILAQIAELEKKLQAEGLIE